MTIAADLAMTYILANPLCFNDHHSKMARLSRLQRSKPIAQVVLIVGMDDAEHLLMLAEVVEISSDV
jgi:hypothetical protein